MQGCSGSLLKEGGLFVFTFKQIESHIDSGTLDYIKDNCLNREMVNKDTEIIPQDGNKTIFRSIYHYKMVVDEKKYKRLVQNFFELHIAPDLQKKGSRKKKEIGKNITQREFFETIFRENFQHRRGEKDKQGRNIYNRTFLVNIDVESRLVEEKSPSYELEKVIKKAKRYNYFTPNLFISHESFAKELLTQLGVIVLDFDLNTVGISMTKEELYKYIGKKLKIHPAMIWDTKTKGNYQACILIKSMTGTPRSVHIYEQIVKEMIFKLEICDVACGTANHIFSIGKNNPSKNRVTRKYNSNEYSIDDFRWLLHERDERRKKNQGTNNVLDFSKEAIKRHPAIKALFAGEDINWRDHACFTLGLVMKFLGESQEECENFVISSWQPKVSKASSHPFSRREALKCIRNAYSDKYKCFHSSWVEKSTGIECNLKGYFRQSYESKGIYVTDTETRLKAFLRKNGNVFEGKIAELAETLAVSLRTLKRILPELRDKGELQYETKRGRGAKTTFTLVEKEMTNRIPVIAYSEPQSIDVELNEITELEEVFTAM